MATISSALFDSIAAGHETYTTSDAIIAEVVFILSSKHHYGVNRPDVTELVKPFYASKDAHFRIARDESERWTFGPLHQRSVLQMPLLRHKRKRLTCRWHRSTRR